MSQLEGIGETFLIVRYAGYFEEMNAIVEGIRFCQVKQIFAPYSPHLFPSSFPGVSEGDCQEKDDPKVKNCKGNADPYGNHRSPKIVSLKHHWWWIMNIAWDGLEDAGAFWSCACHRGRPFDLPQCVPEYSTSYFPEG